MKRLIAIGLVWVGCTLAWLVLGAVVVARSGDAHAGRGSDVFALWGAPIRQLPLHAARLVKPGSDGMAPVPEVPVAVRASTVDVTLALEHRKRGLVWFPTYVVDFAARYELDNDSEDESDLTMRFPLAGDGAIYDGFEVTADGGAPIATVVRDDKAEWTEHLGAGERRVYIVRYRSRGTSQFGYDPTAGTGQASNVSVMIATDFADVDFPPGSLSPTAHRAEGASWRGEWTFKNLFAHRSIAVDLPQKMNPGPLAAKITFFAPVALLFFFFAVSIAAAAKKKSLHPMHYFLLGCAFFAFHLLFSYLVDHLAIAPSFAIASSVSLALTVSYARWFVGWRFALAEIGVAQLVYLVLFSFTFFFEGFTGLAVTIGAILTLFVIMQRTGRTDWKAALGSAPGGDGAGGGTCPMPYRCAEGAAAAKP